MLTEDIITKYSPIFCHFGASRNPVLVLAFLNLNLNLNLPLGISGTLWVFLTSTCSSEGVL